MMAKQFLICLLLSVLLHFLLYERTLAFLPVAFPRRASSSSQAKQIHSLATRQDFNDPPLLSDGIVALSTTDKEFTSWLTTELEHVSGRHVYDQVFENAITAIVNWRMRYRGNPSLWRRIFKKERVIKELVESAPIIHAVQELVENYVPKHAEDRFTIVDLASGKGYLSMFLSEMLPPTKVEGIVLIDKAWPRRDQITQPHHIYADHIYGNIQQTNMMAENSDGTRTIQSGSPTTYFEMWPIPLHTSKQDLKKNCDRQQMKIRLFDKCKGPIVVLAIHLCGTLSLKAVDMFNENDNVKFFALKPCCLPGMVHAQRGDVFCVGNHSFLASDVCSTGYFRKKQWNGPPRWHLEKKFNLWADNLYQGVDIGGAVTGTTDKDEKSAVGAYGRKDRRHITIQVDGGFQNTYVFSERSPLTSNLWIAVAEKASNVVQQSGQMNSRAETEQDKLAGDDISSLSCNDASEKDS
jgi:hypothetical protein